MCGNFVVDLRFLFQVSGYLGVHGPNVLGHVKLELGVEAESVTALIVHVMRPDKKKNVRQNHV